MILLRAARERAGLSQKQLAEMSGVSQQHISLIETDARPNPGAETLLRLATALHVRMEDLISKEASRNG